MKRRVLFILATSLFFPSKCNVIDARAQDSTGGAWVDLFAPPNDLDGRVRAILPLDGDSIVMGGCSPAPAPLNYDPARRPGGYRSELQGCSAAAIGIAKWDGAWHPPVLPRGRRGGGVSPCARPRFVERLTARSRRLSAGSGGFIRLHLVCGA